MSNQRNKGCTKFLQPNVLLADNGCLGSLSRKHAEQVGGPS